ncbi:MAG: sugar phosphate nucleotidyltransferase [Candidatus Limnocylindrus sp.]
MSAQPYAVILAGGGGTRLWPLSSPERPKPFIPLVDGKTLLASTVERLLPLVPYEDIYVLAVASQAALVRESLPSLPADQIITEPIGRNTGPAIALAAERIDRPADAPMLVLPADHAVLDAAAWRTALSAAIAITEREPAALVTLGVTPTRAATGFGYIVSEGERVTRFTEKPDAATAQALIAAGARWNAGTFVWRRAALMNGLQRFAASTLSGLDAYETITPAPIDTLLMEPAAAADLVRTLPLDCGWSDVGNWRELRTYLQANGAADASGSISITTPSGKEVIIDARGDAQIRSGGSVIRMNLVEASDAEIRAAAAAERGER